MNLFYIASVQAGTLSDFNLGSSYILDNYSLKNDESDFKNRTLGSFLLSSVYSKKTIKINASVLGTHSSGSPTVFVRDAQVLSNIDVEGNEGIKVYELNFVWEDFSSGSFALGWVDLSAHFNTSSPSYSFVNSSFGTNAEFGNTGFAGPSIYPVPTFGFKHHKALENGLYVQSALMDPIVSSISNGAHLLTDIYLSAKHHVFVFEAGQSKLGEFEHALGFWNLKTNSENLSRFVQTGFYMHSDYKLSEYLHPFLKWGRASKISGRIYSNLSLGVLFGFGRDEFGYLGLGFTSARLAGKTHAEEVFEAVYSYKVRDSLSLVASTQIIVDPGGERGDAFAGTFRIQHNQDWF